MTEPYYNVGLTDAEMTEVILLIDDDMDEPVNEDVLRSVRTKLASKRRALRKRVREGVYA